MDTAGEFDARESYPPPTRGAGEDGVPKHRPSEILERGLLGFVAGFGHEDFTGCRGIASE